MKSFPTLLAVGLLALPCLAETQTGSSTVSSTNSPSAPSVVITLPLSSAVIAAPLVLTNDCLSQPEQTELAAGGKAVFNFTITHAGTYVIQAVVNAPEEDANSFFINIDGKPEDPMMIWDVAVTSGFEERIVSWRGHNGDMFTNEFAPKRFELAAGTHQLILIGREPAKLKSLSLKLAGK
ncbi:MAG: hypothetical protein U1F65_08255 [Verrucomicrobiota bacterium]